VKKILFLISALAISAAAGCNGVDGGRKLISVDFKQGQTLRYRFVSSRDIDIDWDPSQSKTGMAKNKTTAYKESLELVMAYAPVEIDPYGLTTVKATCESVKVNRTSTKAKRKDAVQTLPGKSFTIKVSPNGKIADYSNLNKLIHELGDKAFRPGRKQGRIKEPDMISDFWAVQWFLWDAVSSIPNAAEGVDPGQSWTSRLFIPTPMVLRKGRNVTYTLDEIRQTEKGQLAVISSSYALSESVPKGWSESEPDGWPIPYSGRFQMSGTFGFLRGYKVLELQGSGQELFNIDAGRTEQSTQDYQVKFSAKFPASIGASPLIEIKQKLTMKLLQD